MTEFVSHAMHFYFKNLTLKNITQCFTVYLGSVSQKNLRLRLIVNHEQFSILKTNLSRKFFVKPTTELYMQYVLQVNNDTIQNKTELQTKICCIEK